MFHQQSMEKGRRLTIPQNSVRMYISRLERHTIDKTNVGRSSFRTGAAPDYWQSCSSNDQVTQSQTWSEQPLISTHKNMNSTKRCVSIKLDFIFKRQLKPAKNNPLKLNGLIKKNKTKKTVWTKEARHVDKIPISSSISIGFNKPFSPGTNQTWLSGLFLSEGESRLTSQLFSSHNRHIILQKQAHRDSVQLIWKKSSLPLNSWMRQAGYILQQRLGGPWERGTA